MVALYLLAQTFFVQSFLAHRAANYLSDELKTTVRVDGVEIRFFKSVVLKGLYVQDLHKDTLLYAEEFKIDLSTFSFSKHKVGIKNIKLSRAKFYLTRYHGEQSDNIKFISDYFSSTDTTASSSPWKITFGGLQLEDVHFTHHVLDDTLAERGVDFSHLDIKNFVF
jgi:hypothetical protein